VTVLDSACGSGNFLCLALQGIKDIELRANLECETLGLAPRAPAVGPEIVRGIEINPLAAELARTTIWIGDIQWRIRNGIYARPEPILRKLDSIECRDALLTKAADGTFAEASWPDAEFIVGNPPFLGIRLMRAGLGDETVERLFDVYDGRVSREADLVIYWFEKALSQIEAAKSSRVGLVATNSIRGGANRQVVDRIETLYNRDDPSDVTGVPTGYGDLDRMTSGFQPGDLIVVAGRPSMGKSSLALNIGEHVALNAGMPVAVFSLPVVLF